MRTSANDSVKDPRTTAITVNEEALPKEEFEFRSQTKIERALKTLQRLSGLTTLLSTYQLVPMTLTLLSNPSSFNLISTSLAATSLILSLALAFWSTKVLKNEQSRHLLSQELNWEGVNTGLFVTLLIRAALSLVLIPNMLLQPNMTGSELAETVNNLSVPLPLIELMVFFVFLSAAKTTFSHIKQSGRAMSSLIFFSNIAMLGCALGLVYSVLRLKAFPFQGDFAMLFPGWNMNGLLRLGTIASFTSFLVWLVNFRRWRVPSVFCTIILGALVLSFTALSISGYSNAHSVEREHGPEFARPFLGFSNLGMLSAVFGMLTFIGGSYFWRRHYNFIETNKKRNLAGFAVLFSLVLVFAFARGVYWHPFNTSIENGGYSTKTSSPFHAKHASQMTIREAMLVKYMMNDLESLDQGIKNTANDLNSVITLFENTKRRGFFSEEITTQLWSFTESLDQASEYVPKEAATELFALFGGLDNLEGQLNDAADGVSENTRALKNYALQLWPWSKSLPEESEDFRSILPNSGLINKLWGVFGSLNKVQDSIEDTKLQLASTKAAYKDAQRTALQTQQGDSTTELWPWSHKLNVNDASSYKELIAQDGTVQLWWIFSKVSTLHGQLKDASQRLRGAKKEAGNATIALWPSRDAALADYRNFVPSEQQIQLWSLFGSADEVETSLDNVNNELDYAQGVYTDAQDKGLVPQNAELWSIGANSPRNYANHKEVLPNATQTLWSLFGSVNKSEQALSDASAQAARVRSSIEDAQTRGVLPTEKTVEAWSSHWQDNLPQRFMTQTWTSGWHGLTDNIPSEETTQAWGDHWSVVDKLPNLRMKTTQLWEPNWGEAFPREAATQLFSLFGKVNSLENSINTAKNNVAQTQGTLTDAQNKGLLSGKLSQEELMAFWSLFGSAEELRASVNDATQQINQAQTDGLVAPTTELWPWSDSLDEYNDYKDVLPKVALTEFWSWFGSYSNDLQESVEDASNQIQDAQSQRLIPTPETTETWTNNWIDQIPKDVSTQLFSLFSSLASAQSSLNDANQKLSNTKSLYQNAQNLGLVSKDNAQTTTTAATATKSNDISGSLNSIQSQLNAANQKISNIKNVYQNAQNLGLVAKQGAATPSELWALPGSLSSIQGDLSSVNQKLNSVQSIYSNAQNIGLTTKQNAASGYLNSAQSQLNTANQKLNNMQNVYSNAQNLGLVSKPGATVSEFWSLSDTLDKADPYIPKTTELWSLFGWFSSAQDSINSANQKLSNVKSIYQNAQNLGLVTKENANAQATTQPTQLWSKAVENVEKYKEFLPVEVVTGFWQLFSSVSDLEGSVADASNRIQEAQEKGVIPSAETAETWSADWIDKVPKESQTQLWSFFNWFSSAQTSLNTANQKITDVKNIYNNAQQLGLVAKENANANAGTTAPTKTTTPSELWGWSHEVSDFTPSQLWSLWGSLNDAQASLATANQKLQTVQNMQQNAKNLGLIGDQSTTSTGQSKSMLDSLSDANSKLQSINSMQQSAKNLGLISDQATTSTGQPKSMLDNLNDANSKLQSINNIQQSAKNLGLIKDQNAAAATTTTPTTESSKSWFSSLNDAQSSLNTANQKLANVQSIYQNAQNLGLVNKQSAAASNKLWVFSDALSNVQGQLNTANQKIANVKSVYQSSQNLGLVAKENATPSELWSLSDNLDKVDPYIPKMTELWSFWGWLTSAQDQVNSANQKINNVKNIYNNAQNLGLVTKENANNNAQATATPSELWSLSNSLDKVDPYIPKVTELWSFWGWLTSAQDSLNTANQKVANVKSIYQNAQNIGLVAKGNSATPANSANSDTAAADAAAKLWSWSDALDEESDFKTPIPKAVLAELWGIFGSLSGLENSVQDANQQIEEAKREFEATQAQAQDQTLTPEAETKLWTLFGKLSNVDAALENATQTIQSAQDRGVIPVPETVDAWDSNWLDNVPKEAASELWGLFGSLNNLDHSLADTKGQLQGVGVTYQGAQEQGLVGKEGELTRLFWPFTKSQSVEDKAKSALESAKTSVSNAGSTIGDKAKSAYASAKTSAEELSQKASETAKTLGDKAKTASEDAKNAYATGKNVYNTGKNVANAAQNQPQQEGELTEMFWPFTKSESVQDKAKNALESAKSSVNSAGSTVQDKAQNAYNSAKTSADQLSQKASETAKSLADKAKTASEDAKNAYNTGKTVANTVQNQPQEVTTELFWPFTKSESVQDKAKSALESAKSSVSSAGSTIQDKTKSAYDSAKSSAEELSQKASETAKSLADKAKTASEDAKNAYATGKNVANTVQNQPQEVTTELFWPFTKSQSVEDKAKSALESAKSSVSSAGSTVQDKAKSAYDSAKTSADQLSQKASETAKSLADKAKTASEDAKNAFNTGKTVANAVQNQPQEVTTELFWPFTKSQSAEDKVKSALESAKSSVTSAGASIQDKTKSAYDSAKTSADQLSQKASETAKSLTDKAKTASEDAKNAYNTGKTVANTVQNQPQEVTTELFWPFTKSESVQDKAKNALESAKSSVNSAGSTVQDKAQNAYNSAKTSADQLSQKASETAKSLADKAKTASEDAKNAYNTGKTVASTVQNQSTSSN